MKPATVTFDPPRRLRAIRFELTEAHIADWWSIYEVYVFAPAE
jgi:hypothetical protein